MPWGWAPATPKRNARFELVEGRIIRHLEDVLSGIDLERPNRERDLTPLQSTLEAVTREWNAAVRQKNRLHELLELGEYDLPTYRERMSAVKEKIEELERRREDARLRLEQAAHGPSRQAAGIRTVLDAYGASDAAHRNALLHTVIERVIYRKEKKTRPAAFELEVILRPR